MASNVLTTCCHTCVPQDIQLWDSRCNIYAIPFYSKKRTRRTRPPVTLKCYPSHSFLKRLVRTILSVLCQYCLASFCVRICISSRSKTILLLRNQLYTWSGECIASKPIDNRSVSNRVLGKNNCSLTSLVNNSLFTPNNPCNTVGPLAVFYACFNPIPYQLTSYATNETFTCL